MKIEIPIEVKSTELMQKTVRGKKDGKEYVIREQTGWIDVGKDYPQEIRIPIEIGKEAYPKGKYLMDPSCVYIARYQTLSLGRLRLIPLK